jgi:hypothetical protein
MVSLMRVIENSEEFERGLMLGLSRSGKPVSEPLTKLSLLSAQRKFAPLTPPDQPRQQGFIRNETSALLPDAARKHLIKLVAGRDGDHKDAMAHASFAAIHDNGFTLHPFDYSELEDFMLEYADDLGPDARQWLSIIHPEKKIDSNTYFDETVTDENLTQASRAQKLSFLRGKRLTSPSRARELIETIIAGEVAETRLKLLSIIATHLGEDDRNLIERHLSDRAPTVKELANRLLSRLPGTEGHQRQLGLVKDYFEVKTEGLLRRRKVLKYKGPDEKKIDARNQKIMATLEGVSLPDFATALSVTPDALAEMAFNAEDLRGLHIVMTRMLIAETRTDLLTKYKSAFEGPGFDAIARHVLENVADLTNAHQDEIIDIILQPESWKEMPILSSLSLLHDTLGRPLSDLKARQILECKAWRNIHESNRANYADIMAPLVPSSLSTLFISMIESVSPRAATYHRFLNALAVSKS